MKEFIYDDCGGAPSRRRIVVRIQFEGDEPQCEWRDILYIGEQILEMAKYDSQFKYDLMDAGQWEQTGGGIK